MPFGAVYGGRMPFGAVVGGGRESKGWSIRTMVCWSVMVRWKIGGSVFGGRSCASIVTARLFWWCSVGIQEFYAVLLFFPSHQIRDKSNDDGSRRRSEVCDGETELLEPGWSCASSTCF
jgi:hypothetical protein